MLPRAVTSRCGHTSNRYIVRLKQMQHSSTAIKLFPVLSLSICQVKLRFGFFLKKEPQGLQSKGGGACPGLRKPRTGLPHLQALLGQGASELGLRGAAVLGRG